MSWSLARVSARPLTLVRTFDLLYPAARKSADARASGSSRSRSSPSRSDALATSPTKNFGASLCLRPAGLYAAARRIEAHVERKWTSSHPPTVTSHSIMEMRCTRSVGYQVELGQRCHLLRVQLSRQLSPTAITTGWRILRA